MERIKHQNTIDIRHISKTYVMGNDNTMTALKDVSLQVAAGEFVSITGASGSGKSTLMHILGLLDTPSSGKYMLDNVDTSVLSDDALAQVRNEKIGFVFQEFNLLPRSTVFRNVCIPLIYAGTQEAEIESMAKSALLSAALPEQWWTHHSNQLSGGQRQRVAIARALVNNPALILADEPTGNLDSKTSKAVLDTFRQLHKSGRTIILITHEMSIAESADRIIHIRDGEIISDRKSTKSSI